MYLYRKNKILNPMGKKESKLMIPHALVYLFCNRNCVKLCAFVVVLWW